jgi:hypothetical protein
MRGFAVIAAIVLGCSSKEDGATPANDTGTGDAASDTPSSGGEAVIVVDDQSQPIDAAHVQILAGDGTVISEGVSDKAGKLTLNNFTLGDKPTWIVAYKDNKYSVEAFLVNKAAVEKAAPILGIPVSPLRVILVPGVGSNPKLSGKITGGTDGAFNIVSGNAINNSFQNSATYSVRATPNKAGKAVVTQVSAFVAATTIDQTFHQFVLFDTPAITADTVLDLDIAKGTKLTSKKTKGTAEITGGKDGPLGGDSRAFAFVSADDPGIFVGGLTKCAPKADGSAFDFEFEWVDPGLMGKRPIHLFRIHRADDSFTQRFMTGWPTDGEVFKSFPLPLAITVSKLSLSDEISFEGAPPGAFRVVLANRPNQDLAFRVSLPDLVPGTAFKLPKLPDEALAILPATMSTRLGVGVDPGEKGYFMGFSQTRAFTLTK